jgi:hypothetical protein
MGSSWADRAFSHPSNSLFFELNSMIGRRGEKVKGYLGIFCCTELGHIILLGIDFWEVGKYKKKRAFPGNLKANRKFYLADWGKHGPKRRKRKL